MWLHLTLTAPQNTHIAINSDQVVSIVRYPNNQFTTITCVSQGGPNVHQYTVREEPQAIYDQLG